MPPADEVEARVGVVYRHVHVRHVVKVVRWNQHRPGRNENRRANVVVRLGIEDGAPHGGVTEAELRALHLHPRCLVGGRTQPVLVGGFRTVDACRNHVRTVQARAVRGINSTFKNLRPVHGDDHLGDAHPCFRSGRPPGWLKLRHGFSRTHVGPDKATPFLGGVCLVFDFFQHATGFRLGGHLGDIARHVHLPAVIEAAQPTLLVPAEHKGCSTVRAVLVHNAHLPFGVSEHHEVFTEDACFDRGSVRLRHLFNQTDRNPVSTHQLPHRGTVFNAAQQIVFFMRNHGTLL